MPTPSYICSAEMYFAAAGEVTKWVLELETGASAGSNQWVTVLAVDKPNWPSSHWTESTAEVGALSKQPQQRLPHSSPVRGWQIQASGSSALSIDCGEW